MDKVLCGQFLIQKKLGAGSFGTIYEGEIISNSKKVAIKLERVNCAIPQLSYESRLYQVFSSSVSVPRIYWFGNNQRYNVMVIDLLSKSLEDLLVQCGHKLSVKTVLMVAYQMITCVEFIHKKSFIHQDIKPDNFAMGLGNQSNQVFVIDFGLSKKYQDPETHEHIRYSDGKSLTGTPRYASINALKGVRQARRDDMESLGYVWAYLLRGSLPWMGISTKDTKIKYDLICESKISTPPESLFKGFPKEFAEYLHIVKKLSFAEEPKYEQYKQMMKDALLREGYTFDYMYDWVSTKQPKLPKTKVSQINEKLPKPTIIREVVQSPPKSSVDGSETSNTLIGSSCTGDSEEPATCEAVAGSENSRLIPLADNKAQASVLPKDPFLKSVPFVATKEIKTDTSNPIKGASFKKPPSTFLPRWMIQN